MQESMMKAQVEAPRPLDFEEACGYVSAVDRHEPFQTDAVRRLVETVILCKRSLIVFVEFQTDAVRRLVETVALNFLVHEFLISSRTEWQEKVQRQRESLLGR